MFGRWWPLVSLVGQGLFGVRAVVALVRNRRTSTNRPDGANSVCEIVGS
jgi:hypothetical protein